MRMQRNIFMQIESHLFEAFDTVDERNPSPPEMYKTSRKRDYWP